MGVNRKNALDNLAEGFMSTRPAAFDKFLQQPSITLPTETNTDGQRVNSMSGTSEILDQAQEDTRVENQKQGNDGSVIDPVLAKAIELVNTINGKQTEAISISKRSVSITAKPKKLAGHYEELFLSRSDQHQFNPGDQRVYLKKAHAIILNRLVSYCKQTNCRTNIQAILDNILQHHIEQYASEIKQVDQQLLSLLTQQINN